MRRPPPKIELPKFVPRRRVSDLEYVYEELKKSIMMGEFAPGQKLRLDELSKAFGTSHMPVREALNRLIVARCLESEPRKSPAIPMASVKRVQDLMFLRKDLETKALVLAMRDGRERLANRLHELNERLFDYATRPVADVKTYLATNCEFHFEIYTRCGNDELISIIELLWMRYGPLLNFLLSKKLSHQDFCHHGELISALKRNDIESACRALAADLEDSASLMLATLLGANDHVVVAPRRQRRN